MTGVPPISCCLFRTSCDSGHVLNLPSSARPSAAHGNWGHDGSALPRRGAISSHRGLCWVTNVVSPIPAVAVCAAARRPQIGEGRPWGAAAKSEEPRGGPESQKVRTSANSVEPKSRLVVCWDGDLSRSSSCFQPQLVQQHNPLAGRDADSLPRPGQGKPPAHLKDAGHIPAHKQRNMTPPARVTRRLTESPSRHERGVLRQRRTGRHANSATASSKSGTDGTGSIERRL